MQLGLALPPAIPVALPLGLAGTVPYCQAHCSPFQPRILNKPSVWLQNLTEEQGDTLLVGRRQMTSSGHVLYHVGVSASNATGRFAGHYQCVVERQFDRLFALSTVAVEGRASPPLPQIPQLELSTCRQDTYNR